MKNGRNLSPDHRTVNYNKKLNTGSMFNTQFQIEKLNSLGYYPPHLTTDRIVRFAAPGKPKSNRSAWAKLCIDGTILAGNWATGETLAIRPDTDHLSDVERQQRAEAIQAAQAKQKALEAKQFEQTRLKAIALWQSAGEVFEHTYLGRKKINPHGVRFLKSVQGLTNALIIPVYDAGNKNRLQSLQFVDEAGNKRFLKGGRKKAGFYPVSDHLDQGRIVICEGFATGATLVEYYFPDDTVLCAFDAGSLEAVAVAFRKQFPKREMIIAGDNDHEAKFNTGLMKGRQAALVAKAEFIYPHFHDGETGSDFNDHWHNEQAFLEKLEAEFFYSERGVCDE